VANISAATPGDVLRKWTAGALVGCRGPIELSSNGLYKAGTVTEVTRQLSGQSFSTLKGHTYTFELQPSRARTVLAVLSGGEEAATVVEIPTESQEWFFSTAAVWTGQPPGAADRSEFAFSSSAPLHIFLTYAAGERAWHTNGHYANLTIDDPLLNEPYGHLQYSLLLREMQEHRFHTTIAYIPWNFDRTEAEVVALFRDHPKLFSIAIHGNNHDHREFPSLKKRPLEIQAANVKQALARMERFQKATALCYDRVMVFPHYIAPEATLHALKRYNYWATANSSNIPADSAEPEDPQFPLRPATLDFANFPAIRRYSAEVPISQAEIAINAFLGGPALFYIHHEYFVEGIGRFNSIAAMVNRLEPSTVWCGLGEISRHLYIERLRQDGNYDIRAFGSNLQLTNVHAKDVIFFVEKTEDFAYPLELFVDGVKKRYSRDGNTIRFAVPIRAGEARRVEIRYHDELDWNAVPISRHSLHVAALRFVSEFRDKVLSRNALGRRLIRSHYS
jgi:peptidoglycan/xylan/chitin deacetylase (PgdA/CDA1 family)